MIKLEHVSKSYSAGIPALNDISLNIEEGCCVPGFPPVERQKCI